MDNKQERQQGKDWVQRTTPPTGGLESELYQVEHESKKDYQYEDSKGGELAYANWN